MIACPLVLSTPLMMLLALAAPAQPSTTSSAPAQPAQNEFQLRLSTAAQLYEELEYEKALEQVIRAKAVARGVEEDVAAFLYEGLILADLGRREEAIAAFKTALYLKPTATLPVKVSPKVGADLEMVRQEVNRTRQHQAERERMVRPPNAPIESPEKKLAVQDTPASQILQLPSTEKRARPVSTLTVGLLGATVATGTTGGFFGVLSRAQVQSARNKDFLDESAEQLKGARQNARIANTLFVLAGAAAAGTLISYFTRPEEPSSKREVTP